MFSASVLIILALLCTHAALSGARARRTALGLEERIEFQRRIEQVYWRYRSATQPAGQAVVSFSVAMPDAAIRTKVEETLRKSAALTKYWDRPLTSAQLQAEMTRMAAQSKQPAVLRELFDALENDPVVIAECLARPLLVERELQAWYAKDERIHGELHARVAAELAMKSGGMAKSLTGQYSERKFVRTAAAVAKSQLTGEQHSAELAASDWQNLIAQLESAFPEDAIDAAAQPSSEALPVARTSALQEDATQLYVISVVDRSADEVTIATVSWPKQSLETWWSNVRNDLPVTAPEMGATYELPQIMPAMATAAPDDSWAPTTAPLSARVNHTAVWTGSEMIVWGGFYNISNYTNYSVTVAGRYNPATDSWTLSSITGAPNWRERHTAVWTGTEMIVWGGYGGEAGATNTGGRYNPATNKWTRTSLTNAPTARSRHTAVWTGSRIVWGGRTGDTDDTTVNTAAFTTPAPIAGARSPRLMPLRRACITRPSGPARR